ncbi:MAG TPA: universal stress protein [Terriglobales bacterium]|nr:universal stress protein [Terriglobales bacterium]
MSQVSSTMARILVGVDGSEGSAAAIRWASRLALTAGAEVVAVHVIDRSADDVRPLGLPRAILNEADWREAVEHELAPRGAGRWRGPGCGTAPGWSRASPAPASRRWPARSTPTLSSRATAG